MDARRRLLDDLAKVATSAVGMMQGASREAEELVRQRLDRVLDRMELVSREEFDAVQAMAQAAREENERLAARIDALEAEVAQPRKTATKSAKTSAAKSAAKPRAKTAKAKAPAKPRAARKTTTKTKS